MIPYTYSRATEFDKAFYFHSVRLPLVFILHIFGKDPEGHSFLWTEKSWCLVQSNFLHLSHLSLNFYSIQPLILSLRLKTGNYTFSPASNPFLQPFITQKPCVPAIVTSPNELILHQNIILSLWRGPSCLSGMLSLSVSYTSTIHITVAKIH